MTETQRLRAIGVVLLVLGVVTAVVGIVGLLEARWVVDPLRYRDVRYVRGYRTGPTIHVVADTDQIYRLPERLWPEAYDGVSLAARLNEENLARARVVGGQPQFWFGYPTIEYFETPTLILEAPRVSHLRAAAPLLAASVFGLAGVFVLRRLRK